ncbi:MAG: transposase [Candidatus Aminicenantales bacterium]
MPRTARELLDDGYFHIYNRGNDRQGVFHSRLDYLVFIGLMREAKSRFPLSLLGFCLMPNHFHFIIHAKCADNIRAFVHWTMTCYTRHYQTSYETSGHLWQGRFKSLPIDREEYLIIAFRYVEGNPKRAGLVDSNREWEWTSLASHCARDYAGLTDPPPFYLADGWPELVDAPLTEKEFEAIEKKEGQSPSGTVP